MGKEGENWGKYAKTLPAMLTYSQKERNMYISTSVHDFVQESISSLVKQRRLEINQWLNRQQLLTNQQNRLAVTGEGWLATTES